MGLKRINVLKEPISNTVCWAMFFAELILLTGGSYGLILDVSFANVLIISGFTIMIALVIILLYDIIVFCEQLKWLWLIALILLPPFSSLFYIMQRDSSL